MLGACLSKLFGVSRRPSSSVDWLTLEAQRVDEQGERGRRLPATRVVEVVAREWRTPVGEHARESTFRHVRLHHVVHEARQPEASPRRVEHRIDAVENELTVDAHSQLAPTLLELPGVEATRARLAEIDAVVVDEILRRLRLGPRREVGRRADDCHAQVRPDAYGDHVLRHLVSEPHAGVVTVGDDVGQAVVDVDFHLDVGVAREEPGNRGPEDRVGGVIVRRDSNRARGLVTKLAECGQLRVDLVERWTQRTQQALASFGRRNAPRRAIQEPNPEPCLEAANGVAERRLRNAELCRSTGEAPLLCNRDERHKITKLAAAHS